MIKYIPHLIYLFIYINKCTRIINSINETTLLKKSVLETQEKNMLLKYLIETGIFIPIFKNKFKNK